MYQIQMNHDEIRNKRGVSRRIEAQNREIYVILKCISRYVSQATGRAKENTFAARFFKN